LPGHVRQRVRLAIAALADDPRPPGSRPLDFGLPVGEPCRLRIDRWRIVYALLETDQAVVAIVAIRRRPPYSYQDPATLFEGIV
jgi:mRNA-degrading endonuclease RelE of RelBE toxin-antitoxin system